MHATRHHPSRDCSSNPFAYPFVATCPARDSIVKYLSDEFRINFVSVSPFGASWSEPKPTNRLFRLLCQPAFPPIYISRDGTRKTRRLRSLDNSGCGSKKGKEKVSRFDSIAKRFDREIERSFSSPRKNSIRVFQQSGSCRTEAKQRMTIRFHPRWIGSDSGAIIPLPPTRCNFRRFHAASTTIRILIRFFHGGWIIKAGAQPIIAGR